MPERSSRAPPGRPRLRRKRSRLPGSRSVPRRPRSRSSSPTGSPQPAPSRTLGHVETISLARGVPAPDCIPVDELADCARAAVERDGTAVLSYGPAGGYQPLREWIAERHAVDPARVLITNGSLQGLVFLAERFRGERVLVEAPTYDRPLKILAVREIEVAPVRMDDEGLELDDLERALSQRRKPALLYTIPTFQNPSGRTLAVERRRGLV